jgi:hypothetical protein
MNVDVDERNRLARFGCGLFDAEALQLDQPNHRITFDRAGFRSRKRRSSDIVLVTTSS